MRKLCVEGTACNFELLTHTGFCMPCVAFQDVSRYAPLEVEIAENTSSQTDEYIAQNRVIPFELTGDPEENFLNVKGREVCAFDFEGDSFRAVENVPGILPRYAGIEDSRQLHARCRARSRALRVDWAGGDKVERAGEDGNKEDVSGLRRSTRSPPSHTCWTRCSNSTQKLKRLACSWSRATTASGGC